MGPVPEDTTRVAHAACPDGHVSLRLPDERSPIVTDTAFAP
jgi:hypothetical protein